MAGVPTTKRGEIRLQKFLETGERLFREKGYSKVTLNEVVQIAGGSLATVYKLFKNKDELFVTIFELELVRFGDFISGIKVTGSSFSARIKNFLKQVYSMGPEESARIYYSDGISVPEMNERFAELTEKYQIEPIAEHLKKIASDYGIRYTCPVNKIALAILRMLRGTLIEAIADDTFDTDKLNQAINISQSIVLSFTTESKKASRK